MSRLRRLVPLVVAASTLALLLGISSHGATCVGSATDCENQLPGTPLATWDINGAGDPTIQGYATDISVNKGGTVDLKINTDAATYRIDIYRLGWYSGSGARLQTSITKSLPIAQTQPPCLTDATTGLVDCGNWAVSASWQVPATAVSGVYVARLMRLDTLGASHVVFVVRDDASTSPVLFQTSDQTWQAYNRYGGASLYTGAQSALGNPTERAYKVSYNRPFTTRAYEAASWLFAAEYPMIRFLERNGYDVSYTTGVDSERRGNLIQQHKTFLTAGHDEYWSGGQRANVEAARDHGVNLAFFTGNDMFWKTRFESSIAPSGAAHRTLVSYKESTAGQKIDPSPTWTGNWRDGRFSPPSDGGRPENALTGQLYQTSFRNDPIFVPAAAGKLRFWRNTPMATLAAGATGTLPTGVLGYEWNVDADNVWRPPGQFDVSSSTFDVNSVFDNNGGAGTITHNLTQYRAPSGALVFAAGTIQWSYGLDDHHDLTNDTTVPMNASMQQATVNILADMGAQPALLMASLVPASPSTDTAAPSSTVSAPAQGTQLPAGVPVVVTGTAADAGGGQVAGVEVSVDGGHLWHEATGRASWTYTFTPASSGAARIVSRAVDDSGNLEAPTVRTCPCTIFPETTAPSTASVQEANAIELGTKFRSDRAGYISGIRFYKGAANTGTHVGHLWTATGQRLATVTFTNETATGWQQADFGSPVAIQANTTYVVSYFAPAGGYSLDRPYFVPRGADDPPLHALADGADGANGLYFQGGSGFPADAFNASNYWVDVVFDTVAVDRTPPTVSTSSPANGAVNVAASTRAIVDFSEPMATASISSSTITLRDSLNRLVPAAVAYDDATSTATLTPTAGLSVSTTFTVNVSGGAGGVTDRAGNALASSYSWSFSTGTPRACPCTVWPPSATPGTASSGDGNAYEFGMRFRSDQAGYVAGIRFYKGPSNTGTHTGHLWTNTGALLGTVVFTSETAAPGWQEADFTTPVAIAANTTYVVSYTAPNGGYALDRPGFATGVDTPPLHALADGLDGANGVYSPGGGDFPSQSFGATNYWVDVVFDTSAVDRTPPTIVSTSPAGGATGVAASRKTSVRFSEPIAQATLTQSNLFLAGGGPAVPAAISFDAATNTATLTPTSPLSLSTAYTLTVKGGASGITNTGGIPLAADSSFSFTTATPAGCPCTLFPGSATPAIASDSDASPHELGVKFRSDLDGYVSGLRFYKGPSNFGVHVGHLWTAGGTQLAQATFTGETASGWQQVNFPTPVAISANTTYVASYYAPNGGYSLDRPYFNDWLDRSPLHALAEGVEGSNGVYATGTGFPTSAFETSASNYWVDVLFDTTPDRTPPTVISTTPDTGATGVFRNATVSAVFSELLDTATVSTSTLSLRDANGILVPAAVTYDAATSTAKLTPGAPLAAGASYTATISGGPAGVKDRIGNPLAADRTWTFTVSSDTTAPATTASCNGGSCADWFRTSPVSVALAATEETGGSGVDAVRYTLDGTDPRTSPTAIVYTTAFPLTTTRTVRYSAADRAGNVEAPGSVPVRIDVTPPAAPTLSFGGFTNASYDGTTVWYRAGAAGAFTVTPSSTDPESGVSSYTFPALGSGWSPGGAYAFAAGAADPTEPNNVTATNGAGLVSPATPFAVAADGTAPATTISCAGAPCAGWYTSAPTVSLNTLEIGSGTGTIFYSIDNGAPTTVYTAPFTLARTATVRFYAVDKVGNVESVHSLLVEVDTTAPAPPTLTLTGGTASAVTDSTVFYNPAVPGGFTVGARSSDAESDIATYNLPKLGTGWSGSGAYTYVANPTEPGPRPVTATNKAGLISDPTSFTVVADSTAPTSTIACTTGCGGWHAGAVTVTLAAGDSPGGSGLDRILYTLGSGAPNLLYSGPLTLASTATVTFAAYDRVGNVEPARSQLVQVDTTPPSAPTLTLTPGAGSSLRGGILYFNPAAAGALTVAASGSSDAESGFASYTYPALGSGWTGSNGAYSFAANAVEPGTKSVGAANGAGLTASTPFTVTADSTAPTSSIDCGATCTGWQTSGSVTVTLSAADTGAGTARILYSTDGGPATTAYTAPFTVSSTAVVAFRAVDNVGNAEAPQSRLIQIDTTAPAAPVLAPRPGVGSAFVGGVLYFNPAAAGGFELGASAVDAESGIHHLTYPSLGSGWTGSNGAYSFLAGAVDPVEPLEVTATNNALLTSPATRFTVTADTHAPVTAVSCGGSCDAESAVPVSLTLTSIDDLSGVDRIVYTTNGSDPAPLGTTYTGSAITISTTTTVKYRAYDKVGNAEAVGTQLVRVDSSPPATPVLTLSEASPWEYAAGGQLYYNPSSPNTGSFSVTATTSDAQSPIARVTFPSVFGTDGGDLTATPYTKSYAWSSGATATGSKTVTVTNGAGLTSSAAFTLTIDAAAPTGGSVAYPDGFQSATSVTVTTAAGADNTGGSGLDPASALLQRDAAALVNGACVAFTDDWKAAASPDTTLATGTCYRYRYTVSDNVGNTATYASTNVVKVDTSAPAAPALTVAGTTGTNWYIAAAAPRTIYYGTGSGTFGVTAAASDPESGVKQLNFPAVPGFATPAVAGATATYGWSASTGSGTQSVTATNNALLTGAGTAFTVVRDVTGPETVTVSSAARIRTGAAITATALDAGAGVKSVQFLYCSASPCTSANGTPLGSDTSAPYSVTLGSTPPDGAYFLAAVATDNVNNTSVSATLAVTIDNAAPITDTNVVAGTNAGGQYWNNAADTLFYNPGSGAGDFTILTTVLFPDVSGISGVDFPAITAPAGFTGTHVNQTTPVAATTPPVFASGAYGFTAANASAPAAISVVTTDTIGNAHTDTVTFVRDVSAPAVSLASLAPRVRNGVQLSATASDGQSGIRNVAFRYCPGTTCAFAGGTAIGSVTAAPFGLTWNGPPSDGTYTIVARATDNVGNVGVTDAVATVTVDNTAPVSVLTVVRGTRPDLQWLGANGTYYYNPAAAGDFTLADTPTDAGTVSEAFPAVAATGFTGSAKTATAAPFGSNAYSFTTASTASPGPLSVVLTDDLGNQRTVSLPVVRDTAAPTGSSISYPDGYVAGGTVTVTATNGTDAGAGLDPATAAIERQTATLTGNTCGTFGAWGPASASDLVPSGTCAVYRFRIADRVGNQVTSTSSNVVKVDLSKPSAPTLAASAFSHAALTNGTIFYNPALDGGFTVAASSTDGESGVASYSLPSLGTGWSGNGTYTYTAGAAAPGTRPVTAINNAGLTSDATTLAVAADATAPTTAIACTNGCAGWHTASPVTITLTPSDAGAGVAQVLYSTTGGAPTTPYGGPFTIASTATLTVASVDRVGNTEATQSLQIQIDTTAPSSPSLAFSGLSGMSLSGSTLFYLPGTAGGFTVTPTSTDAESGIASYAFPSLGSGWSNSAGAYTFTAQAATPASPVSVTAANGAGRTAATAFSVIPDSTAPVTAVRCNGAACGTDYASAAVDVSLTADDGAGSGVSKILYTVDGSDPGATGIYYLGSFSLGATTTVKFRAYDMLGNAEPVATQEVRIDTTPPSVPALSIAAAAPFQYAVGNRLYYNPSGSNTGSFTLSASSDDTESQIARIRFPSLAGGTGGGDATTAPYSASYTWTSATTASGTQTVTAFNNAGLTATADLTLIPDTTAPSGGSLSYPNGVSTATSITVTTVTGDDGSGAGLGTPTLERQTAALVNGVCQAYGAWSAVVLAVDKDTVPTATCAQYRYSVPDLVGNVRVYTSTNVVKVDSGTPTAPTLSISESSPFEYVSSAKIFYNPNGTNSGSFTVTAATTAPSGIAKVAFPAVATMTGGGDVTVTPYRTSYSWTAGATANGAQSVTATSNAGRTASASFTVTRDVAAPTGQSAAISGGPWFTTLSVPLAIGNGTDALAGVDTASRQLERASAPLLNGTCGTWTAYAVTTPFAPTDTNVQSGTCYRYRFTVSDRVGNASTPLLTGIAMVDTSAPTAPALTYATFDHASVTGSTVYYNATAAGSFSLGASSTDPESGIASYAYPAFGSGWTTDGAGTFTFAAAAADPAEPNHVTARNAAGLTSAATDFTVTADGAGPTDGSIGYADGYRTTTKVSLTLADGTDALSGVDTATEQLQRAEATMTEGACSAFVTWTTIATDPALAYDDTTVTSGHCYAYRYVVTDKVGNQSTFTSGSVARVDAEPPTAQLADPGANLRQTVTLVSTQADTGGSGIASVTYQRAPAGTTNWTTVPQAWVTTAEADGLYDLRAVVLDRAGNRTTSNLVAGRRVDNTPPGATFNDPGANLRAQVTLTSTSLDSGSGVDQATVAYERCDTGGAGANCAPLTAAWDTTTTPDGVYDLRLHVKDVAGNETIVTVANRRVDNTAPNATMGVLPALVRNTITLDSTTSDSGSRVKSVTYAYRPAGGLWTDLPGTSVDTNSLADGDYEFRVTAVDNAGNSASSAPVATHVDNKSPYPSSVSPAAGTSNVATTARVTATFPRAMTASTLTGSTFTLTGPSGAVAAAVAYTTTTNVATLTPSAPLAESANYTARLTTAVTDANGNALYQAYTWTFSTGIMAPTVTASTPADGTTGTSVSIAPTATFNRAMLASTVSGANVTLRGPAGTVGAAVAYDASTKVVTLTPTANLAPGTQYTVQLGAGILSQEGVALAPYSWSFTTASAAAVVTFDTANTTSIAEGATATTQYTYAYTIANGGTVTAAAVGCGSLGTLVAGSSTFTNTTGSFKCTFNTADGGPASTSVVSASVTGNGGQAGQSATQNVSITNVAPVATISSPLNGSAVLLNAGVTFSFKCTDVGKNDATWTWKADWKDATTSTTTTTVWASPMTWGILHTYKAKGNYTVTLTCTDKDGGVGSATTLVIVA